MKKLKNIMNSLKRLDKVWFIVMCIFLAIPFELISLTIDGNTSLIIGYLLMIFFAIIIPLRLSIFKCFVYVIISVISILTSLHFAKDMFTGEQWVVYFKPFGFYHNVLYLFYFKVSILVIRILYKLWKTKPTKS